MPTIYFKLPNGAMNQKGWKIIPFEQMLYCENLLVTVLHNWTIQPLLWLQHNLRCQDVKHINISLTFETKLYFLSCFDHVKGVKL